MPDYVPFEVLIVEDEPMIRMVAVDAIAAAGMTTREAGDAVEALQLLNENRGIGLLFTDIHLPGEMCGLALSHEVHGQRDDMEFILTSGAQSVGESDLRNYGTFLPKPYTTERLMELVHRKCGFWRGRTGNS
jgi:DNA-binding NtrC family response regulator